MDNTKVAKIRPGYMIALHSTVQGGVSYQRVDLAAPKENSERAVARWETTRVIEDPIEHERANKARSKARGEITKLCCATAFGLLCPKENATELTEAVARAQAIIAEHNSGAIFTRIGLYVLKGEIASSDEEATRSIMAELASLVAEMNTGIDRLEPKKIRDAADRATQMIAMLGEQEGEAASAAIEAARRAARQIVKRVEKEGEAAAIVLKDIQRGALEKARIAFLDLSDAAPASAPLPSAQLQRFADLDTTAETTKQ
jgi:hypothetical protein